MDKINNQRILFEIAHPKHFHQFKHLIEILKQDNQVYVIARHKDVVVDLLKAEEIPFETYGAHGKSLSEKVLLIPRILKDYFLVCRKFKPTLVISKSSPYAAVIGKVLGFKTCIMNDSEIVGLTNHFVAPLTSLMITPITFPKTKSRKHILVDGLFEEAYLSPEVFMPDVSVLNELGVAYGDQFALLRFVGWYANHDAGNKGFSLKNKVELCELLSQKMKVYISHEGELPYELRSYDLPISPEKIHNVLHFASLYIGDSQTMATEAALLGTPSIRFNSFVGEYDMANFKFLEHEELLINVGSFKEVLQKVTFLIEEKNKEMWMRKRDEYFGQKKSLDAQILGALKSELHLD